MLVFGKWKDNITCKRCRYRHPADVTCKLAREVAHANRREPLWPGEYEIETRVVWVNHKPWTVPKDVADEIEMLRAEANHS